MACWARPWLLLVGGDEGQAWGVVEQPVVGNERTPEAEGGRGDPAVAVVELVGERVADPLALDSQLSAAGDHLVVGLHDAQLGDAPVEVAAAQFAPSGP